MTEQFKIVRSQVDKYKDLFQEVFPERMIEVHKLELFEEKEGEQEEILGRAYRVVLNHEDDRDQNKVIYTLDMDDTLNQYTEAKALFHQEASKLIKAHIPESLGISEEIIETFLYYVNKGSRLLSNERVHPECYYPNVEIGVMIDIVNRFQEGTLDEMMVGDILRDQDDTLRMDKIRTMIIELGIMNIFGDELIQEDFDDIKERSYFQMIKHSPFFETALSGQKVNALVSKLFDDEDNKEQQELFKEIYKIFQNTMFNPQINKSVFPSTAIDGKVLIATFGEDNFQAIKVKNLITNCKDQGVRIPDEILFFEVGRKAALLNHIQKEDQRKIIHLDNSANQCQKIQDIANPHIRTILFDPAKDKNKSFKKLIDK